MLWFVRCIRMGRCYSRARGFSMRLCFTVLLTIVLECFHLVSLFNILSRLIQENRFLQQNWLLSPASCISTHIQTTQRSLWHLGGYFTRWPSSSEDQSDVTLTVFPLTRLSAVSSGISWTTQWGKSSTHILQWQHTRTYDNTQEKTGTHSLIGHVSFSTELQHELNKAGLVLSPAGLDSCHLIWGLIFCFLSFTPESAVIAMLLWCHLHHLLIILGYLSYQRVLKQRAHS